MIDGGINRDFNPIKQPKGTYRDAENMVYSVEFNSISNEKGTLFLSQVGYTLIKGLAIDSSRSVLFAIDEASGESHILVLSDDNVISTIYSSKSLNFQLSSVIDAVWTKNFKGETLVCWTDNINPPRIINVDDENIQSVDSELLSLFPEFKIPRITIDTVNDISGQLLTGAYYFALAYELEDGSITNYISVSNPVMIHDDSKKESYEFIDGSQAGIPSSKSIKLKIKNIDERYKSIRLAVIQSIGGVKSASYAVRKEISDNVVNISYSGAEFISDLTVDEIIVDRTIYRTAKTMTLNNNRLYLGNLSTRKEFDYQELANNIKVKWDYSRQVSFDGVVGSYKDENVIYNYRGFMPNEVYAFYIAFRYKDGSTSKAFHIPGREAEEIEFDGFTVMEDQAVSSMPQLYLLDEDNKIGSNVKLFQTQCTARTDGRMGYWENENELYPSSTFGKFSGKKIRHHRFPSLKWLEQNTDGRFLKDIEGSSEESLYEIELLGDVFATDSSFRNKRIDSYTATLNESIIESGSYSSNAFYNGKKYTAIKNHVVVLSWDVIVNSNVKSILPSDALAVKTLRISKVNEDGEIIDNYLNDNREFPRYESEATREVVSGLYREFKEDGIFVDIKAGESITYDFILTLDGQRHNGSIEAKIGIKGFQEGTNESLASIEGTKGGNVLGASFSNILIPDEIKEQINGFSIYYAKRDSSNQTVAGMSLLFLSAYNSLTTNIKRGSIGGNYDFIEDNRVQRSVNDWSVRFHAFDLLKDKPTLVPSYLQLESVLSIPYQSMKTEDDSLILYFDGIRSSTPNSYEIPKGSIKRLQDYQYVPADTLTSQVGNRFCEECVYANVIQPYTDTLVFRDWYDLDIPTLDFDLFFKNIPQINDPIDHYMASMMVYRTDMYLSYDNQELVSTGKIYTVNSESETYSTGLVYNGDTFLSPYSVRLTAPLEDSVDDEELKTFISSLYYFPTYSISNTSMRHVDVSDPYGAIYPSSTGYCDQILNNKTFQDFMIQPMSVNFTNSLAYNIDYSSVNTLDITFPFTKSDIENTDVFPNRIARSNVFSTEDKDVPLRYFSSLDYYEMRRDRGEITAIQSYDDSVIINTRYSTFRTQGKNELKTDTSSVVLGSGDVFNFEPKEVLVDGNGYAGCQHLSSTLLTKAGYFFVDSEQGKLFLLSSQIEEISNYGLRNYFRENWGVSHDNPLMGEGYSTAFDESSNRLIISHLSQTLTETISFSFYNKKFTSFHTYASPVMWNGRSKTFIANNFKVYQLGEGNYGEYFDTTNPSYIELVDTETQGVNKVYQSLSWVTSSNNIDNTFDSVFTYNSYQASDKKSLIKNENVRRAENTWRFNKFRNMIAEDQSILFNGRQLESRIIDLSKDWRKRSRMLDKYLIAHLESSNTENNPVYLQEFSFTSRYSFR